ncbi:MAG: glycoside hydrolase family 3 N-terminal domain-containing protein [Candidatus Kapaibacteriales bacterium]
MLKNLKSKISQMLVFGFPDAELTDHTVTYKWLKNNEVGGVILFDKDSKGKHGRNIIEPNQVKNLIEQIKSIASGPIFIGIDQEGGIVARLNSRNGFFDLPSHSFLGGLNHIDSTMATAIEISELLSTLGFNLNFAPVVDLSLNPDNPIIAKKGRSFGRQPEYVFNHSKVFINEHRKRNILCVAKHFPGHGSALLDTHSGWVDSTYVWQEVELKPYQMLIESEILDAVMTAHIFNANIDPKYPATLSKIWLCDVLRDKLRFKGLVFSDDLQMKAIAENFTLYETVYLAITAGVDVLLFANMQDPTLIEPDFVISIILDLVDRNEIPRSRIDETYDRIQRIKNKYLMYV